MSNSTCVENHIQKFCFFNACCLNMVASMRFVVPIPLWIYLVFALVAISVGATALYIALALFLIYMLITRPRQIIGFFLGISVLSVAFQYWKLTLLGLLFALIFKYIFRNKEGNAPAQKLIESDGVDSSQRKN